MDPERVDAEALGDWLDMRGGVGRDREAFMEDHGLDWYDLIPDPPEPQRQGGG